VTILTSLQDPHASHGSSHPCGILTSLRVSSALALILTRRFSLFTLILTSLWHPDLLTGIITPHGDHHSSH